SAPSTLGTAPTAAAARPRTSETPAGRDAPFILFGAAGLGGGIGAITGAGASHGACKLASICPTKKGYDDAGGTTYDSAKTLSTVSTIGFITGGMLVAVGIGVLVWNGSRTREPVQAGFVVAPAWVGLMGSL